MPFLSRRYLVVMALLVAACGGGSDVSGPQPPGPPPPPPPGILSGSQGSPAAAAIPNMRYVPRAEDFTTNHPDLPGIRLSFNTLILALRPEVTVGQANALLGPLNATVVGGVPRTGGAPGILAIRLPTQSHAALGPVLAGLRSSPHVVAIVQDVQIEPAAITRPGHINWTWELTPTGGNWGMEAIRVPQLWNLYHAVRKTGVTVLTGVYDAGTLHAHTDLPQPQKSPSGSTIGPVRETHATHVTGTIAARFGNGVGVDGVNPFATIAYQPLSGVTDFSTLGAVMAADIEWMLEDPAIRVINVSLRFGWRASQGGPNIDTDQSQSARDIANASGALIRAQLAGYPSVPVIVAAAGNESAAGLQQARYASPFANAALEHQVAAIIVVEAAELQPGGTYRRAAFSNVGGHVSAPGADILSTGAGNGYFSESGTSMAAPHVTGLVGFLYALDPALPRPTLTTNPIRGLLIRTARAVVSGGASPLVDAWAAALELDRDNGNTRVLRMLLDIDDGTKDGNQRTTSTGAPFTDDLDRSDAPRAGSAIDMADFRRWRDWLLQLEAPPGLRLDGGEHLKKDLNLDSQVQNPAGENRYPRGDFNGDGVLSRTARHPVPGVLNGQPLTDLEVLQHLFVDPDYRAADLPDLILSGDAELDPAVCLDIPGASRVTAAIRRNDRELSDHLVVLTPDNPRKVMTSAVHPADYVIRFTTYAEDLTVLGMWEEPFSPVPGGDDRFNPHCQMLNVVIELPEHLTGGATHPLDITVRLWNPNLGEESPADGATVSITATGGSVAHPLGITDDSGRHTTTVTITPGATQLRLVVKALRSPGGLEEQVEFVQPVDACPSPGPARTGGLRAASKSDEECPGEGVAVTISPVQAIVNVGAGVLFTATVTGSANTGVIWSATGGAITTTGFYTAGNTPGEYSVTATSVADPTKSASATVTIPGVQVVISPTFAEVDAGATRQFSATVTGAANTGVTWSASGGTITGTGLYAAGNTPGEYSVTATSVADPSRSASATVVIPPVEVTITPTAISLLAGEQQQFTVLVTGTTNTAVTWTATGGTISTTGLYTAGASPGEFVVRATSVADPTQEGVAAVTITAQPSFDFHIISEMNGDLPVSSPMQFRSRLRHGLPTDEIRFRVTAFSDGSGPEGRTVGDVSNAVLETASTQGPVTVSDTEQEWFFEQPYADHIEDLHDGIWFLATACLYRSGLPVTTEGGAMVCRAKNIGIYGMAGQHRVSGENKAVTGTYGYLLQGEWIYRVMSDALNHPAPTTSSTPGTYEIDTESRWVGSCTFTTGDCLTEYKTRGTGNTPLRVAKVPHPNFPGHFRYELRAAMPHEYDIRSSVISWNSDGTFDIVGPYATGSGTETIDILVATGSPMFDNDGNVIAIRFYAAVNIGQPNQILWQGSLKMAQP